MKNDLYIKALTLVKQLIVTLRPGLSGIGSIFFRNEQLLLKQGDYLKVYKTRNPSFLLKTRKIIKTSCYFH